MDFFHIWTINSRPVSAETHSDAYLTNGTLYPKVYNNYETCHLWSTIKCSYGIWGSAVSSPSGVWGGAPAEIEIDALLPEYLTSGGTNFTNFIAKSAVFPDFCKKKFPLTFP